jgi:hypothetical protein
MERSKLRRGFSGVEGSGKDASIMPYQATNIFPHLGQVFQQIEGRKWVVQPHQG